MRWPSTAGCAPTTQPGPTRQAGALVTARRPGTVPRERARVPGGQLPAGFLAAAPDAAARKAAPAAGPGHCLRGRPGRPAAHPPAAGGAGPALYRGWELQAVAPAAEGHVAVPAGPDGLPVVAAGPCRHLADPGRPAGVYLCGKYPARQHAGAATAGRAGGRRTAAAALWCRSGTFRADHRTD